MTGAKGLRVLIPTADYPPIEGGISTVCRAFAHELAARGHQVTVLAPWFPGMAAFDAAEPVAVIRFRGYGLGWLRGAAMFLRAVPLLRRCDAIAAINISYGGAVALFAHHVYGTPFLAFAYAYEFLKFRRTPLVGSFLRHAYARSAAVIAISAYTRDNLLAFGVPADRIAVVLPGAAAADPVSPETAAAVRERFGLGAGPIVLSVGRLIARKNHEALVRAMPRILADAPDATLVIAGRGPRLDAIRRLATELHVADQVRTPGYVDDAALHALYGLCTVFALPAGEADGGQVEGFGLVFTEAHGHGKPVVGGRSGGVVDAVIDGETGVLVKPGDDAALAEAIAALLADPVLAARMGAAGRKRVEETLNWRAFTAGAVDAAGWERDQ